MNIKFSIVLMLLLFTVPLVLASEADIFGDKLTIKIYNTSKQDYTGENLTSFKIEFISQEKPSFNNKDFTFSVNLASQNISYKSEAFDYIIPFIIDIPENISFYEKWMDCEVYSAKLDTGYTICNSNLVECREEYEGENATSYKEDLNECTLTIKEKDLDITSKNKEIEDLKEEAEETKNAKYFWGAGGVVLGILGLLFYRGELGKGSVKDKSQGEFNPSQAG